jgi:uncharacterized protein
MVVSARPEQPPTPSHAVPVRTCVGCRRRDEQTALLRVVAVGSQTAESPWSVRPDLRRRGGGRGAYVHPDQTCVRLATERRAFARALRRSGRPDTRELQGWLDEQQT